MDRSDVNVEETGIYTVSATYRGFNATATVSVINTSYTIPDGLKDTSYWFIAKNETQNKLIAGNTTGKFGTASKYGGILKFSGCTGGKMNGWVSTDGGATWTQVNKNDSHYGTVGTNGTTIIENTNNGVALNFAHVASDVITFLETSGNFEITYGS